MYEITRYNANSQFWLDDNEYKKMQHNYKLSPNVNLSDIVEKYKIIKTISNFVNIVTSKQIPVEFKGVQAKSDGHQVIVSADVKDFDSVCGLSLHEASHIKYSHEIFDICERFINDYKDFIYEYTHKSIDYAISNIKNDILKDIVSWLNIWKKEINEKNISKVFNYIHELINIVEDFRIDALTIKEFPGYKGYYQALTDWLLLSDKVEDALVNNPELSKESYFSYKLNLAAYLGDHPKNNLLSLKGGQEIVDIIDPKNIIKKSGLDVIEIVFDIFRVINKYVINKQDKKEDQKTKSNDKGSQSEKSKSDESEKSDEKIEANPEDDSDGNDSENSEDGKDQKEDKKESKNNKSEDSEDHDDDKNSDQSDPKFDDEDDDSDMADSNLDDIDSSTDNDDSNNSDEDVADDKDDTDYSDVERDPLSELGMDSRTSSSTPEVKDLLDAINDKIDKKSLTHDEAQAYKLFSNKKFKIKTTDVKDEYDKIHKVDVVVVNKLDESVLSFMPDLCYSRPRSYVLNEIKKGLNLGRSLGNKLQLMNDIHISKSTRRKTGNIDDRLLSEIGHGNIKIFNQKHITEYESQFVHITIDSSGSMDGFRFINSLKMAAVIASAGTYINGMRVQVSIRSTVGLQLGKTNSGYLNVIDVPYVIIIYDSKFDNLKHIKNWWARLDCPGVTPEAICFEAIKDIIIESSENKNSFFVNISDGIPTFSNTSIYSYRNFSTEHTQNVMNSFRKAGIKILSYFIDGDKNSKGGKTFNEMYGKDANFIDVNNINQIARTMNKKFVG